MGPPPGYVGYDDGGYLTEAVRRRPYSVVLLDEIEKAHPDVFNILLQVLDDGRLTDGKGRTVDFKNCLLIMTSNLGSNKILAATESDEINIKDQLEELLMSRFKPEFLNRIDEIIFFDKLAKDDMIGIVDIQLKRLAARVSGQNIHLHIRESAKQSLVEKGYNPSFGARPIKRTIQKAVEDPLAMMLLQGDLPEHVHIVIEGSSQGLTFTPQKRA